MPDRLDGLLVEAEAEGPLNVDVGAETSGSENLYDNPRYHRLVFPAEALLPWTGHLAPSWMGSEKDVPPGEELVRCFRPFLEDLLASVLSPKTIQRHVDNLWALGGEIIRDLNENPSLRRKSIAQVLEDRIDEEGGPLVYALESEEPLQRAFDSTCRRLYRFLQQSPR